MLVAYDADLRVRPVQALYLALSFKAFGLNPLPYHVAGHAAARSVGSDSLLGIERTANRPRDGPGACRRLRSASALFDGSVLDLLTTGELLDAVRAPWRLWDRSLKRAEGTFQVCPWGATAAVSFAVSLLSYEVTLGLIAAVLVIAGARLLRPDERAKAESVAAKRWGYWHCIVHVRAGNRKDCDAGTHYISAPFPALPGKSRRNDRTRPCGKPSSSICGPMACICPG